MPPSRCSRTARQTASLCSASSEHARSTGRAAPGLVERSVFSCRWGLSAITAFDAARIGGGVREPTRELEDVPDGGGAEPVDRLRVVPDDRQVPTAGWSHRFEDVRLDRVRVLVLVDEDVVEHRSELLPGGGRRGERLPEQQQVVVVEDVLTALPLGVGPEDLADAVGLVE